MCGNMTIKITIIVIIVVVDRVRFEPLLEYMQHPSGCRCTTNRRRISRCTNRPNASGPVRSRRRNHMERTWSSAHIRHPPIHLALRNKHPVRTRRGRRKSRGLLIISMTNGLATSFYRRPIREGRSVRRIATCILRAPKDRVKQNQFQGRAAGPKDGGIHQNASQVCANERGSPPHRLLLSGGART